MNRYEPTLLVQPKRGPKIEWIQIECGGYHTIGITKNGDVFSWGDHVFLFGSKRSVPTKVEGLDGRVITKISCGKCHTAVLTDKGELLTWYVGTFLMILDFVTLSEILKQFRK
mmetsp:Transcript_2401/g.3766  ORF Transcript_2401/g.3766 Transcript_2401/m.3766 type:complete len:113 (+) Transcript_2401:272-610(+)